MEIIRIIVSFLFDIVLFISGTIFIPQIVTILKTKNGKGVSLITFVGFFVIQLASALHGYFTQNTALLTGMVYCMLTCGAVICLAVYFRYLPKHTNRD